MAAPTLIGFAPTVTFSENTVNSTPQLLDSDVVFADADNNFDGGSLTLTGLLAEDTISVRNEGLAAGEIGLSGTDVTFGGTIIGTLAGGVASDLTITFNAAATSTSIDALIQNLTYANSSDTPIAGRTLTINVMDSEGMPTTGSPTSYTESGAGPSWSATPSIGHTTPALGDLDGDGDLDLIVGNVRGTVFQSINTGTAIQPNFDTATQVGTIDVGYQSAPTVVDLDGDGDLDLVIGNRDGLLFLSTNTGTPSSPTFSAPIQIGSIDVGFFSSPTFGDIDGDGDYDLIMGTYEGTILQSINTGSDSIPAFDTPTQVGTFDVGFYSAPTLADIDGDGDLDIVATNNYDGTNGTENLFHIVNNGDVNTPSFDTISSLGYMFTGFSSRVTGSTVGDIDSDGDLDIVLGNNAGDNLIFSNAAAGHNILVSVTAQNDAPTLSGFASLVTYAENAINASPQLLDSNVTFSDGDDNFLGGTLTLTGLLEEDTVSLYVNPTGGFDGIVLSGAHIFYNGTLIGVLAGGDGEDLSITFNSAATSVAIETLVQSLTYHNSSDTPTANRDLVLNIIDSNGADLGGVSNRTISVSVTPENDLSNAVDDVFETSEVSAITDESLFAANVTTADHDPDGDVFVVTEVNGLAASVNSQITLVSGALLTVNSNGTFDYDPFGAFEDLPLFPQGSSPDYRIDEFTYTITGGSVATVTVVVFGVDNRDLIVGTSGQDVLSGGASDDLIVGGAGADHMNGGAGFDTVSYLGSSDSVYVNLSTLTAMGGHAQGDIIVNFEGLIGSEHNDTLTGNSAANIIDGGEGADLMDGGAGNDTYFVDNVGDTIQDSSGGLDRVNSSVDFSLLGVSLEVLQLTGSDNINGVGNSLNNTIAGTSGNNVLSGLGGNDTLSGGQGIDTMIGGSGNDFLDGGLGADIMNGGAGNDTYVVDNIGDTIQDSGTGFDRVNSSVSFSLLGISLEVLQLTGSGSINGTGNSLANTIAGTTGNNILDGLAGNDVLSGGQGTDSLFGGTGDDFLSGGLDADVMNGGIGNDIFIVDNVGDTVVDFGAGTDTVRASVDFSLVGASLEILELTGSNNINGTGNSLANQIFGNSGRNRIDGGVGADIMDGGAGSDTYVIDNLGDSVSDSGGGFDSSEVSVEGYALFGTGIDTMQLMGTTSFGIGSGTNNIMSGNSANNVLRGVGGNDFLSGGGGRDTLFGGTGNDNLRGGSGKDSLVGGTGADNFDFNLVSDSGLGVAGRDSIQDFSAAEGDTIDLSGIDAITGGGDDAFNFIGSAVFSSIAGQLRYESSGTNGFIFGDVDGDGIADFEIAVLGAPGLTSGDFIL